MNKIFSLVLFGFILGMNMNIVSDYTIEDFKLAYKDQLEKQIQEREKREEEQRLVFCARIAKDLIDKLSDTRTTSKLNVDNLLSLYNENKCFEINPAALHKIQEKEYYLY